MEVIIISIIYAASIYATVELAEDKNRDIAMWTLATAFFGIIPLIILALLPKVEKHD